MEKAIERKADAIKIYPKLQSELAEEANSFKNVSVLLEEIKEEEKKLLHEELTYTDEDIEDVEEYETNVIDEEVENNIHQHNTTKFNNK